MIRKLTQINPGLRSSLYFQFGFCPARCTDALHGPTNSRVYRSSQRSVTLQCTHCGVQWTMTVHQLAKAAQRLADTDPPMSRRFAAAWAEWADAVNERRGRPKGLRPAKATLRKKKTA
jgi:hypothetical protein